MQTLILDSTFFPVRIVNWQRAMILSLTGRAETIDVYEDKKIRTVNEAFDLPRVLRIFSRHRSGQEIRFSRQNVFWRDSFTCQYCRKQFRQSQLALDHVIPLSRGGKTSWDNIVTACHPCNTRKGSRTPDELAMKLMAIPKRPSWAPFLCLRLGASDPYEWRQWFPYFSPQQKLWFKQGLKERA